MTDRAVRFNIWREAQRADGEMTVADVAALLDEPEKRVALIVRKNGWAHLFARPAPAATIGFGRIQWEHGL